MSAHTHALAVRTALFAFAIFSITTLQANAQQPRITHVRGIAYHDYSNTTTLNTNKVYANERFTIRVTGMRPRPNQDIRIVLQEANVRNRIPATLRLRPLTVSTTQLTARASLPTGYLGRTYQVSVFVYQRGMIPKYGYAGWLTVSTGRRPTPPRPMTNNNRVVRTPPTRSTGWSFRPSTRVAKRGGIIRIDVNNYRFQSNHSIRVYLRTTSTSRLAKNYNFSARVVRRSSRSIWIQIPNDVRLSNRTVNTTILIAQPGRTSVQASAGVLVVR